MYRLGLALTEGQRRELERARDRDPRPYLRERAAALLRVAAGESPHAVALGGLGLLRPRKPDTVYEWLRRYRAGGAAGLVARPRGHRGFSPSGGGRAVRRAAGAAGGARVPAEPVAAG